MNRAIAGVYDRFASGDAAARAAVVTRALEPDGAAQVMHDGPLAVAWTGAAGDMGAAGAASDAPFCLLDGHLYNLGTLAEQAGLPPAQTSERVLAGSYARWGEAMFEQLRGDFVVLVWDSRARRLIVARDQVNARPLYVRIVGDRVLFASEVRNLLRLLQRRPGPDDAAVAHWLRHSRVPPDRTLYEGITRVEAGQLLRIVDGRPELRRYWTPNPGPQLQGSRAELAEQLRAQVVRAVERRCVSGTTAVMLSGGLDSTTLAAVGARCLGAEKAPVATYSMTFPDDPASDEAPQIDLTTARLGLANTRIAVKASGILAGSLEYLRTWELPPAAFTLSYWLPLAHRVAADGVRVILDGENGDDLFGYSPWLVADVILRGRPLAAARLLRRTPQRSSAPARTLLSDAYTLGIKGSMPPAVHRAVHRLRGPADYAPPWLNDRTAKTYYESFLPWDWKLAAQPRWWANRVATLITDAFPAGLYDHARRRAAMAGLDRRHPFADLDLIGFVHRLPPELAFDPQFNRPLLRESMAGLVPDEIRLQAPKMNLNTFFDDSLAIDLHVMRRLLSDANAELQAYVRPEALRELFADTAIRSAEGEKLGYRAWRFMEVECWLRSQERPSFVDELLATNEVAGPRYELVRRPTPPDR
ncbi:MAG: asparagine synthase-related protein [Chloroflexota bacterium]|nr:asparagine synthase-related protein [Chloroflexota bacterium]